MTPYLVSYDLRQPQKDYQKLYQLLAKLRAEQVLQSAYRVVWPGNCQSLLDCVKSALDQDDAILVTPFEPSASFNLAAERERNAHLRRAALARLLLGKDEKRPFRIPF